MKKNWLGDSSLQIIPTLKTWILSICIVINSCSFPVFGFSLYDYDQEAQDQGNRRSLDQIKGEESRKSEGTGRSDNPSDRTPTYNTSALIKESAHKFFSSHAADQINSGQERVVPNSTGDSLSTGNTSESKLSLSKWNNDGSRTRTWEKSFSSLNTETKKEVMSQLKTQFESADPRVAAPAKEAMNAIINGQEEKVLIALPFKFDEQKSAGQKVDLNGKVAAKVAEEPDQANSPANPSIPEKQNAKDPNGGNHSQTDTEFNSPQRGSSDPATLTLTPTNTPNKTAGQETAILSQPNSNQNGENPISQFLNTVTNAVTHAVAGVVPKTDESSKTSESSPDGNTPGANSQTETSATSDPTQKQSNSSNQVTTTSPEKSDPTSNIDLAALPLLSGNPAPDTQLNRGEQAGRLATNLDAGINMGNANSQSNVNNVAPPLIFPQNSGQTGPSSQRPPRQDSTYTDPKTGAEMKVTHETNGNKTVSTISGRDGENWVPVRQVEKVTEGNTTRTKTYERQGNAWAQIKETTITTENGRVKSLERTEQTAGQMVHEKTEFSSNGHYKTDTITMKPGTIEVYKRLENGREFVQAGTINPDKSITWGQTKEVTSDPKKPVGFGVSDRLSFNIPFTNMNESSLSGFMDKLAIGIGAAVGYLGGIQGAFVAYGGVKLFIDGSLKANNDPEVGTGTLVLDGLTMALPAVKFVPAGTPVAGPAAQKVGGLMGMSLKEYLPLALTAGAGWAAFGASGLGNLFKRDSENGKFTSEPKRVVTMSPSERWEAAKDSFGTGAIYGPVLNAAGPTPKSGIGGAIAKNGAVGATINQVAKLFGKEWEASVQKFAEQGASKAGLGPKGQSIAGQIGKHFENANVYNVAGQTGQGLGEEAGKAMGISKEGQILMGQITSLAAMAAVPQTAVGRNAPPNFDKLTKMQYGGTVNGKPNFKPEYNLPKPGAGAVTEKMVKQIATKIEALGLEKIKGGVIAQLSQMVKSMGEHVEHGFYLVKNKTTGEFRIIPDFLGIGLGKEVHGHYGGDRVGGRFYPHPNGRKVAETFLKEGEEIIGKGHTHPVQEDARTVDPFPSDVDFQVGGHGEFCFIPQTGSLWRNKSVRITDPQPSSTTGWMEFHHYYRGENRTPQAGDQFFGENNLPKFFHNFYMDPKTGKIVFEKNGFYRHYLMRFDLKITQQNQTRDNSSSPKRENSTMPLSNIAPNQPRTTTSLMKDAKANPLSRIVGAIRNYLGSNQSNLSPTQKAMYIENMRSDLKSIDRPHQEETRFGRSPTDLKAQQDNFVQKWAPTVREMQAGLNGGIMNQLKQWVKTMGADREWGFFIVENQKGELRIIMDVLGEGTGQGSGPNGVGYYVPSYLSRQMAEQLLKPGEFIGGWGHTHLPGVPHSVQDWESTQSWSRYVYVPGLEMMYRKDPQGFQPVRF